MVDQFGRWHVEEDYSDYPKENWCACDHIAAWIRSKEYEPQTTMENLISMILIHYENEYEEKNQEFTVEGCIEFIEASGGIREFDYRT